jgi:starch-binding outer membrane protein SusE/F
MKKINILIVVILGLIGFTSCDDTRGPIISSAALSGNMTFKLNQPQYSNLTYVLDNANADLDMDSLTCVQPAYGFTAAVTYTTQVSFSSTFAAGTFQSLATTVNGEKVRINTKEMDKAMIALYGGVLPTPLVTKDVYVRLQAFISDASTTPVSKDTIVKPIYSNSIKIKILPYVLPLFPYTEIAPRLWYIVGLDGIWNNSVAGVGTSLIPLSISDGKKYNLSGDGEFIYTGYFKASVGFKILRNIGDWAADIWGMTGTNYVYNGGGNINVPADGYYKITMNSIDKTLKIVPVIITPVTFNAIGIIGAFNSWGADVALTGNASASNHFWSTSTFTLTADSQLKLRANAAWDTNWGTGGTSSGPGEAKYSFVGLGVNSGQNMIETTGTYTVMFNDIDACYFFIKK